MIPLDLVIVFILVNLIYLNYKFYTHVKYTNKINERLKKAEEILLIISQMFLGIVNIDNKEVEEKPKQRRKKENTK